MVQFSFFQPRPGTRQTVRNTQVIAAALLIEVSQPTAAETCSLQAADDDLCAHV
jgi:hypothetical protein